MAGSRNRSHFGAFHRKLVSTEFANAFLGEPQDAKIPVMGTFDDLRNLLLPSRCAICSRLPKPICESCWSNLVFRLRLVSRGDLRGVAIADYAGGIAELVNAFKERGQRIIGESLANQLGISVNRPVADLLVAAPSSLVNFATRGFTPAEVVARGLAKNWRLPVSTLKMIARREDQAGLGREQRIRNLVGSMIAIRTMNKERVILVDDVVTTGATLTEMARAVTEAGGLVVGFITVAETIAKTDTQIAKKV